MARRNPILALRVLLGVHPDRMSEGFTTMAA